jgi:hypothetical protein
LHFKHRGCFFFCHYMNKGQDKYNLCTFRPLVLPSVCCDGWRRTYTHLIFSFLIFLQSPSRH